MNNKINKCTKCTWRYCQEGETLCAQCWTDKRNEELKKEYEANMNKNECDLCFGTGKEICNNPDHAGIEEGLFGSDVERIGCPLCGHSEDHIIENSVCGKCKGKKEYKAKKQSE